MTTTASAKWNLASIAVIAFAVGAVLTNFMMRQVLTAPLRVGAVEYTHFSEEEISQAYHKQLAARQAVIPSKWLGVETSRNPLDSWMLQEIVAETKPDVILETGAGGSVLALASVLEALRHGHVCAVDARAGAQRPRHERVSYHADAGGVRARIRPADRVMAVLDSADSLKAYAPLVSMGGYLVVRGDAGPFLGGHPEFAADRSRERFGVTEMAWLRRVR